MRKFLAAVALTAATVAPAQAAVVFSDNFDSENGGASALRYTGYANFDSVGRGNTDLVADGDFGLSCSGSCVDLDGSRGPGALLSKASFAFNAGDTVRLSYDVGGSQRGTDRDSFDVRYFFDNSITLLNAGSSFDGGPDIIDFASISGSDYSNGFGIGGASPFMSNSIFFTAAEAGSLQFQFATGSADNIGPLLDNVSLDITAVPEPATWAMMIFGFGLVGGALRRNRKAVIAKPAMA